MPRPRNAALAVVALTLAAGLAQAAPWLQDGYDAARTGATSDAGPVFDDVAWTAVTTPIRNFGPPGVVLTDDAAYVLGWDANETSAILQRVALEDGALAELARIPLTPGPRVGPYAVGVSTSGPRYVASDGERVFLTGLGGVVQAYDLATGAQIWEVPPPPLSAGGGRFNICLAPAVSDATVYAACEHDGDAFLDRVYTYARAIDARTGEIRWTWVHDAQDALADVQSQPASACGAGPMLATCVPGDVTSPRGISVVGDAVVVPLFSFGGRSGITWTLLDPATGDFIGRCCPPTGLNDLPVQPRTGSCRDFAGDSLKCLNSAVDLGTLLPTGSSSTVYTQAGRYLRAIDPTTGAEQAIPVDLGPGSGTTAVRPDSFAFDGRRLYVPYALVLHVFEGQEEIAGWPKQLIPPSEAWSGGLVLANGRTLFAQTTANDATDAIYAIDAQDGSVRWKHSFPKPLDSACLGRDPTDEGEYLACASRAYRGVAFAVSGDRLVVVANDGNVTLLGRTAASIEARAEADELFPSEGEEVTVDMSATGPGRFGPANAFRAEWGDGNVTDWQADPVMRHAYASGGDHRARLMARNDANQTSSVALVFHVGGTEPTFLENAFSAENQNATFFILGLAGTGVGGVIGLVRLRRRRGTLERELRVLEEEYVRTSMRPIDCERMLAERKAHARALFLDRALEESQCQVLERRIDELMRTVRVHEMQELLDQLPYGMARAVHEMLADGQVTAWERRSFLSVLEDDRLLSPDAKARVRAIIDDWYARDTGRAAAGQGQGQGHGQGEGRGQGPGEGEDPGPGRRGDA